MSKGDVSFVDKDFITYYCHTCQVAIKVHKEDDPEFWSYQVKKLGNKKYVHDYTFCSKECSRKYSRKIDILRRTFIGEFEQQHE